MPARLDELLSLRERLQALPPAPEPAEDAWPAIQARLAGARMRRRRVARVVPLAAAASVAVLGAFAALRWFEPPAPAPHRSGRPAAVQPDGLDELRARSRALEQVLAALPARPAVERAGSSVPIQSLEAQVQWLDHQLSLADTGVGTPGAQQLWRERVEVMDSLVRLRCVEAQQVAL